MAVMGAAVATAMNMTPHSPTALGLRRWTRGFPRSVAGLVTLSSADIWILSSARGALREVPIECGVDHNLRRDLGSHTEPNQGFGSFFFFGLLNIASFGWTINDRSDEGVVVKGSVN